MSPLVEIGLSDLPKTGGACAPPAPRLQRAWVKEETLKKLYMVHDNSNQNAKLTKSEKNEEGWKLKEERYFDEVHDEMGIDNLRSPVRAVTPEYRPVSPENCPTTPEYHPTIPCTCPDPISHTLSGCCNK